MEGGLGLGHLAGTKDTSEALQWVHTLFAECKAGH